MASTHDAVLTSALAPTPGHGWTCSAGVSSASRPSPLLSSSLSLDMNYSPPRHPPLLYALSRPNHLYTLDRLESFPLIAGADSVRQRGYTPQQQARRPVPGPMAFGRQPARRPVQPADFLPTSSTYPPRRSRSCLLHVARCPSRRVASVARHGPPITRRTIVKARNVPCYGAPDPKDMPHHDWQISIRPRRCERI